MYSNEDHIDRQHRGGNSNSNGNCDGVSIHRKSIHSTNVVCLSMLAIVVCFNNGIIAPNKFQCQFTTIGKSFDLLPFSIDKTHTNTRTPTTRRRGRGSMKKKINEQLKRTRAYASTVPNEYMKIVFFPQALLLSFDCLLLNFVFFVFSFE